MLLRMLTATIRRVDEHSRRRIGAGKRAVIAHIGSEAAGAGLALGQDWHRGVVGVDALSGTERDEGLIGSFIVEPFFSATDIIFRIMRG